MKKLTTLIVALGLCTVAFGAVPSHWDGGRNIPVHKLTLLDEFEDTIDPVSASALPVSTRNTCGQCHDYSIISGGWHFNSSETNACLGRFSEPWFMIDQLSGSQIPMSLRTWPKVYKPEDIGMTDWEWVYAFGRHLPGGDIAEPEDIYAEGGENVRWEVSGKMEINCFACHSTSDLYDHSEFVRLVKRENFAWAASGAFGLGNVEGMGSRVPEYWDASRGFDPDDRVYKVPPHINYDLGRFDSKSRTVLEVGEPSSENCLNCHSVSQSGVGHHQIDGDVHLRAGMNCSDCHSNGLGHDIARGYEGESGEYRDKTRATASCAGCHVIGDDTKAGRFGAPAPEHVGFPLIHFEKLSCTVCHSGVTEAGKLAQVRTSKANRMGVYGRARWVTPAPFIQEPVFVKNEQGVIEPHRISWPAFWGRRSADGREVKPIKPEKVGELCADELGVRTRLGALLATLATNPNIPGVPALAINGICFAANADGVAMPVVQDESIKGVAFVYLVDGCDPAADFTGFDPLASTEGLAQFQAERHIEKLEQFTGLLGDLEAQPLAEGRYGAVVLGDQIYYKTYNGLTNAPAGDAPQGAGYYLDGSFDSIVHNFAQPALPIYDPTADSSQMTDDQYRVFDANRKKFEELLQTLDASEMAENRYCAMVIKDQLFYRGGTDATVISTNAPAGADDGMIGFYMDGGFEPLLDDYLVSNVAELADSECSLTESMVTAVLRKLTASGEVNPVYVAHGKLWGLNEDGELTAGVHVAAEPVSWALGHDVRPARLARGAKPVKCDDCHTADSDFFFADVRSTGPLLTSSVAVAKQIDFMQLSGVYNRLFGLTFMVRPLLKIFLWLAFGIFILVAVGFASVSIPALLALGGLKQGTPREQLMNRIDRIAMLALTASSGYLALSGVTGWLLHLMTGYLLVLHIVAGGIFALCLLTLLWTRGAARLAIPRKSMLWLAMLILAVVVIFSAVAPMMTIFGSEWQLALLWTHRLSSVAFLVVGLYTLVGFRD
jgi:hypothetical protein